MVLSPSGSIISGGVAYLQSERPCLRYSRQISWTDAFDVAAVHSTLFQVLANDLVGSLIRISDMYEAPVLGGLLGDSFETSQSGVRLRADTQAENNPPNVRRYEEEYPFSGAQLGMAGL